MITRQATGAPTADQVLDKYIRALGGAQKLAALTSYVARGSDLGYGDADPAPLQIFAKAPNQFATIIHTGNGDITRVTNGVNAWLAETLRPVDVLPNETADVLARDYRMSLLLLRQLKRGHWMILDQLPRMRIHPPDADATLEALFRGRTAAADASGSEADSFLAIRIAACRLRIATNAAKQADMRKVIEEMLKTLRGDYLLAAQLEFDLSNL